MLPSTGKFKEINCPFFDSGLCERPYCHFRHVKRDSSEVLQTPANTVNSGNSTLGLGDNGEFLQQIVSEAVRKVLEQTDLPSALARPSGSNAVETVSRNFASKVAEVLAPPIVASTSSQQAYNVSSSQQKVPSYKPTPISVLKNRHIPIPYSPSLTKSSSVLRKRSSSEESTVSLKKLKSQELEDGGKTSICETSSLSSSKVYEPSSVSDVGSDNLSNSNCDSSQYSPAPVKGWKDIGLKYTPSAIETLKPNAYVPSSSNSAQLSVAEYEPTEKLDSAVEPTYEPLAANGSTVGSASYEPSRVSNLEPEYQPFSCDNTAKEYVPTDITQLESINEDLISPDIDLDISPEIDLLHDLLHDELNCSDSEDTDKKKSSVLSKCVLESNSGKDHHAKNLDCDGQTSSLVEYLESDGERHKSDSNKKKSETDKKKNEDKKRTENVRKDDSTKESENEKKKESSKRKTDGRKIGDSSSNSSNKKRTNSERKKDDFDKKKSESRKKSDHSDSERKKIGEKKTSSEKKHSDHHKKKETDKKRAETDRKKSEGEVKKSESDKKKSVSGKDGNSDKSFSNTQNSKQVEKISSANNDHKSKDKSLSSAPSESSHSSSSSEKKNNENRKHDHSHKKNVSGHSVNSNHSKTFDEKLSRIEEHLRLKSANSKRRRSGSIEQIDVKKKTSHKHSKQDSSKKNNDLRPDKINHGNSVPDSDGSDVEILDNVTLPSDTWASSDEETVTKECYRIFQEYEPNNVERKPKPTYQPPSQEEDETPVPVKRRVAHEGAQNSKMFRPPSKRPAAPNPSLILSERFQKIRESHAQAQAQALQAQAQAQALQAQAEVLEAQAQELQAQVQAQAQGQGMQSSVATLGSPPSLSQRLNDIRSSASHSAQSFAFTGGRKRIAHVPNVSILLDAKLKIKQKLKEQQLSAETAGKEAGASTKAQTVPKGAQRIAHVPSEQVLTRPVVKGIGGKIPNNVRQNYLDILVDEYIKISSNNQEAYEKAEEEEKAIFSRSTTRAVYASHVSNTINRLRKTAQANSASTSGKNDGRIVNRTVSHTSMLAGKVGTKGSWSIEKPRKPPASVANKSLYESLSQFIMAEEQLKENGYPLSHAEEKGVAVIHNFFKKPFIPKTPTQRMCARCCKIYYVNQQGHAVKDELCVYHWGRLFQSKTRGGWEARYNCCQGHGDAIGCSVGNCHVSDNFDPNNLRGFVKTLPKEEPPPDGDYGIYALDCEMCYTTLGLELTRVTVIGADLNIVYESLVKPESMILDYNTRFSGIREEDLVNVTTNIYEVQSILLSFINDKTILIGHSLESDFKALKLIHTTVVDTSVVYPHKMGPPKKKALKTLCRDLLQKIIQENEGGHDSAEDARAAMEIMLFKIKEDLKTSW